jgi:hypothetical protein
VKEPGMEGRMAIQVWAENDRTIIIKREGEAVEVAMTFEEAKELHGQLATTIQVASEMDPPVFAGGVTLVSGHPDVTDEDVNALGAERISER